MTASLHEILRPITLTKVISRVAASTDMLLQYFGMQTGGSNEAYFGHGREGTYHVYNNVRTVAQGRAPGTAAGRTSRNPMGRVPFIYPRMHESLPLPAEELHNLAKIDDLRQRDVAGADYIARQSRTLGQKAGNWRTAMLVGMLRDSLYIVENGDTWYPTYASSGALIRLNSQMPAGNKDQLNMLGDGSILDVSWSDRAADIPLHLSKINAGFQVLNGGRLTDVWITGARWIDVIENERVAAIHGTSSQPFKMFELEAGKGPDGTPINEHIGQLSVMPGVRWHITDVGLSLGAPGSETYSKHVGDNNAIFCCGPKEHPDYFTMYQGSEPISEREGAPATVKVGFAAWSNVSANPTATNLYVLDNALPVNHVPNSVAYGTVVF